MTIATVVRRCCIAATALSFGCVQRPAATPSPDAEVVTLDCSSASGSRAVLVMNFNTHVSQDLAAIPALSGKVERLADSGYETVFETGLGVVTYRINRFTGTAEYAFVPQSGLTGIQGSQELLTCKPYGGKAF